MGSGIIQTLWLVVYCGLLAASALTDIRGLRIPNIIPLSLVALFFVIAGLSVMSLRPVDWGSHLLAGGIVFAVGIVLFAWGKFGGGDVKLLTAVALWHGLHLLPALLMRVTLIGGVLALICIALRRSALSTFLAGRGLQSVVLEDGAGIPYAVAIAGASGLLVLYLPFLSH